MKWQDIQAKLIKKNDKEICMDFAIACADKALEFTDSEYVGESLDAIKQNRWNHRAIKERFNELAKIRIRATDVEKRESAHVVIHALELASVNSIQSQAAHAARCGEALSRIDENLCVEVLNNILN